MSHQDDELLASFVAGEISPDAPALQALFERRPDLRTKARELAQLHGQLEREARLEREVIAEARASTTEFDRARVVRAAAPAKRRRAPMLWAAAALVTLAVGAVLLRQGNDSQPRPVPVLNDAQGLRLVVVGGELRAGSALTIENASVGLNQRLKIELFADAQATGEAIFVKKLDAATQWTPNPGDLTALPATVFARAVIVSAEDGGDRVELESPLLRLSVSR
ncbi:MAG: hypothetical protein JNN27_20840 [Planctomycetes bacterium]|nr:hypothetical protein [Planctomycetota bacterium]